METYMHPSLRIAKEERGAREMKPVYRITLSLLAAASLVAAQDATAQNGPAQNATPESGWKRVGDSGSGSSGSGTASDPQAAAPLPPPAVADPAPPPQLTLKAGTYVTVRVNQMLSSDRSQAGDAFTGTLVRPIVIDGFVVASAGQTVAGRVAEAIKAGRAKGVSHLGVQLTDLTLTDGQQVPVQSELLTRNGPTTQGRDAAAIGTTTGVGAAVGAVAAGGVGAAIGAGAGAVASTVGVLLTRGQPTIIYPESVLTFKVDADLSIATDRAPQAFRAVTPADYNQPAQIQNGRPGYPPPPRPYVAAYPYPYYGYPYYGYPYYGGPGIYFGGIGIYGGFRGRFR